MKRIFLKLSMVYTIAMIRPKASHAYRTINIPTLLDQRSLKTRLLRFRERDKGKG